MKDGGVHTGRGAGAPENRLLVGRAGRRGGGFIASENERMSATFHKQHAARPSSTNCRPAAATEYFCGYLPRAARTADGLWFADIGAVVRQSAPQRIWRQRSGVERQRSSSKDGVSEGTEKHSVTDLLMGGPVIHCGIDGN